MEIKVLGTGCPKCHNLTNLTKKVVEDNNIDAEIVIVDDIVEIMEYGIMRTPALVVNGKVIFAGRLPGRKEITDVLTSKSDL